MCIKFLAASPRSKKFYPHKNPFPRSKKFYPHKNTCSRSKTFYTHKDPSPRSKKFYTHKNPFPRSKNFNPHKNPSPRSKKFYTHKNPFKWIPLISCLVGSSVLIFGLGSDDPRFRLIKNCILKNLTLLNKFPNFGIK